MQAHVLYLQTGYTGHHNATISSQTFLHRNKSVETEEVLLVSLGRGGLLAQPWHTTVPTKYLCHCTVT